MQKKIIAIALVVGSNCWISMCSAQAPNNRQNMTPEQRQQQYRLMLQRYDINKNGRLDAPELARMREAIPQLQRKMQDNNGNQTNKPSGEPASNARRESGAQVIQRFDKDGDGVLNDQERAAARQALQQLRQRSGSTRRLFSLNVKRNRLDSSRLMRKYDFDGDGVLNADERRAAIDALPPKSD
jgi:Ca2+-binding EF-hand superfamily protein